MLVQFALIVLSLWLCRCCLRFWRLRWVSSGIYSLPSLPIVGHIHLLPKSRYDWPNFLIEQSNDALRQGHTMIRWWVINKLCVWMLDADTSKVILEHSTELKKGRDYAFFRQWLGQGLLLSDGAKWRRQRRLLTPTFHFAMLEQYVGVFNRHAMELMQNLSNLEGGEMQDIAGLLIRCSLDIVAEAIMGVRLDPERTECCNYVHSVQQFNDLAHTYTTNPLFTFLPFTWLLIGQGTETRQCIHGLKEFTRKVIEERTKKLREGKVHRQGKEKAFLDLLLEMDEAASLDEEELREQVDTFMFEGHDTSAHGLLWTLWCLATHPHCQQQVHAELVDAEADEWEEGELSVARVSQLRYLDRCVKEALRLFPPVPVLERDLEGDVSIDDGRTLPRGAMVMVSPLILHHNEKAYPRHWEFNPDNFLPERVAERSTFDYIPFSAGPRNCIGQKFALLEVKIVLAHILRQFQLSADIPFERNRPALEAILRPEFGLPVRIHRIK